MRRTRPRKQRQVGRLSAEAVTEMRMTYDKRQGIASDMYLAEKHGVSKPLVRAVMLRQLYKDVPEAQAAQDAAAN